MCFPVYLFVLGWAPGIQSDMEIFIQEDYLESARRTYSCKAEVRSRAAHADVLKAHAVQQRHQLWN